MITAIPERSPRRSRARGLAVVAASTVALLCAACANYTGSSAGIKLSFADAEYDDALERVENIDRGSSELLYLYEKGLVLHFHNDFDSSNAVLEQAEQLLEDLYTKSVTRAIAGLTLTDIITKYRGEPFEAVLVNYYKILNYLNKGDLDGALVECRRVNRKLQMLSDAGETDFSNDPFLQYLTGMVYKIGGEPDAAGVSFRVAVASYDELLAAGGVSPPEPLYCDAAEIARMFSEHETADSLAARAECPPTPQGTGVVNLFLECGFVAHKEERELVLPIFKGDDTNEIDEFAVVLAAREGVAYDSDVELDYLLKVAVPILVPTPVPWEYAVVRVAAPSGEFQPAPAVVVDDMNWYAAAAFEADYSRIIVRAIVRGLTKYLAKKGADEKDEGLGWLVNVLGVVTETADTRSWSTLPEKIMMARLALPAGTYDFRVDLMEAGGRRLETITIPGVAVEAGETRFMNHRIF
jgi:hypothetical protein